MLLIFAGAVLGVALASIAATRLAMHRAAAARAAAAPPPFEFPITEAYPAEPSVVPLHAVPQDRRGRVMVDEDVIPLEPVRTARQPR